MLKAVIISIGNELLNGKIVDTTSAYISRKLVCIGITVTQKVTVPDQAEEIMKAVKQARKRSSILLVTGGLGFAKGDITKKAVASALGLKMIRDRQIESSIRQFYKKSYEEIAELNLNQAIAPEGSVLLKNSWGAVPGIYLKQQGKRLFLLPGAVHETKNILTYCVLPLLSRELRKRNLSFFEINIFGIGEAKIREKLEKLIYPSKMAISYLPNLGSVKLVLTGDIPKLKLQSCSRKIQNLFKDNVYSRGNITLEEALGKILKQKKYKLAVAESCTGGLLAGHIVNTAGASFYFSGGIIAYSNKIKVDLLGVSEALLKKYGAVSIPVAKAMAAGARGKFSCKCSIAITGVAGPIGGTPQKPVGYVCIASYCGEKFKAESFQFNGDRSFIRQCAVATALFQMLTLLKKMMQVKKTK